MAKSNNSFLKKQRADKQRKKQQEKFEKKTERIKTGGSSLDDMIAYVDEFGNLSSTPIEKKPESPKTDSANK
jgi:S-adenosylmethionine hydrolase